MILVTGGTGRIGSALVERLLADKVPVRLLLRPEHRERYHDTRLQIVHGDLGLPSSLRPALAGVRRVFLVCAHGPRQAELESNLVHGASAAGVEHLVKISGSPPAIDAGCDLISAGHREVEGSITKSGMAFTILRPAFLMQNLLTLVAPSVHAGRPVLHPFGDARIAMVDARDVARVAALALTSREHFGAIYRLTGPAALSLDDVAAVVSGVVGYPVPARAVPLALAQLRALATRTPAWLRRHQAHMVTLLQSGRGARLSEDVERVSGCRPTALAEFVRDHVQAFTSSARAHRLRRVALDVIREQL